MSAFVVLLDVWVVESVKGSLLMEFFWLFNMCHMLSLICYFLRSCLRLLNSGLYNLLLYLLDFLHFRGSILDSLTDMGWIHMIMRSFMLLVDLMAIIKVESGVRMIFRVIKGMNNSVLFVFRRLNNRLFVKLMLNFRLCNMHRLILNILMNYLMLWIVLLFLKNCRIHMYSRVEKGK